MSSSAAACIQADPRLPPAIAPLADHTLAVVPYYVRSSIPYSPLPAVAWLALLARDLFQLAILPCGVSLGAAG